MKIRNGFVSNSSSTSFTLYGIEVANHEEFLEKFGNGEMYVEVLAQKWGLGEYCGDNSTYIGLIISGDFEHCSECDMRDDETKIQFMDRIKNSFPEELRNQCNWHSESYYNG